MTIENIAKPKCIPDVQIYINKFNEAAGTTGQETAIKHLESSGWNLDTAVRQYYDLAKIPSVSGQVSPLKPVSMSPDPANALSFPKAHISQEKDFVDLTQDESDIQRAIALSLRDSTANELTQLQAPPGLNGAVSTEDLAISRALEARFAPKGPLLALTTPIAPLSLNEGQLARTHPRESSWMTDPLNPYDRQRPSADWPVGLKNVGNTCWFSSVVQALFHIPYFRTLVCTFIMPEDKGSQRRRHLLFMYHLRHLFALMLYTNRKYVDPTKAVQILRDEFSSVNGSAAKTISQQQDISECTHKLLDWLEKSYTDNSSDDLENTSPRTSTHNPMVDLFNGVYKVQGSNQGNHFTNEERFGQYPLQVNGFCDIYDSLDSATAQGIIENSSASVESTQESWFTRLPPVLILELSRFQFNQSTGTPDKIHNKLNFPDILYMDRYMEFNMCKTREKRENVRRLKELRSRLLAKLDGYKKYHGRCSLKDALESCLDYTEVACLDEEMPVGPPVESSPSSSSSRSTQTKDSSLISPQPSGITQSQQELMRNIITRWRDEVYMQISDLEKQLVEIDDEITGMYADDHMTRLPYKLHGVLVHEGEASTGHYWAYIRSHFHNRWRKFNDLLVTEATLEEVERDSVGGHGSSSAYCLMYISANRLDLLNDPKADFPTDLVKLAEADNLQFAKEKTDWDNQQCKVVALKEMTPERSVRDPAEDFPADVPKLAEAANPPFVTENPRAVVLKEESGRTTSVLQELAQQHARMASAACLGAILGHLSGRPSKDSKKVLVAAFNGEVERLREFLKTSKLSDVDPRLRNFGVYLMYCGAPNSFINRFMFEAASQITESCMEPGVDVVVSLCEKHLRDWSWPNEHSEQIYYAYHSDYRHFRQAHTNFLFAMESFQADLHFKSLSFLNAYFYYCNKMSSGPKAGVAENDGCVTKCLDGVTFSGYLNICHCHDILWNKFNKFDNVQSALDVISSMIGQVVPVLHLLTYSPYDLQLLETIREQWCSSLNMSLEDSVASNMELLLERLFEPPVDKLALSSVNVNQLEPSAFLNRYHQVLTVAQERNLLPILWRKQSV